MARGEDVDEDEALERWGRLFGQWVRRLGQRLV